LNSLLSSATRRQQRGQQRVQDILGEATTARSAALPERGQFGVTDPTRQQRLSQALQQAAPEQFAAGQIKQQFQPTAALKTTQALGLDPEATIPQTQLELQRKTTESSIQEEKRDATDKIQQGNIKNAKDLRNEFTKLSKVFISDVASIERVRASIEDPSAAGDLALVFNFMKILDPGSTVREGEFANAESSAGVPERVRAQYNKIVSGERLSTTQRKDFGDTAENLFKKSARRQNKRERVFGDLAGKVGAPRDQVTIDFTAPPQEKPKKKEFQDVGDGFKIRIK